MDEKEKEIADKYFKRFGQIAVEKGYITEDDLMKALKIQVEDDLKGRPHRLLGNILFQMGAMHIKEIEDTLEELFKLRDDMKVT